MGILIGCYIVMGIFLFMEVMSIINSLPKDIVNRFNFEIDIYDPIVKIGIFIVCLIFWPFILMKLYVDNS